MTTSRVHPAPADASSGATAPLDLDAIEHDIWQMLGDCGAANKNEKLIVAITALIETGVNTGPRIIAAATRFGFQRGHAGAVLSSSEGINADRHLWKRDESGVYRVHVSGIGRGHG